MEAKLRDHVNFYRRHGQVALAEEFVLTHGKEFEWAPFTGQFMEPKQCFHNAALYAGSTQLDYICEGYIWTDAVPIVIHHAWCSKDGVHVIDPTLRNAKGTRYFGVAYPTTWAIAVMLDKGTSGLFIARNGMPNLDFFRSEDCAWFDRVHRELKQLRNSRL
jgi:hypothetical protein